MGTSLGKICLFLLLLPSWPVVASERVPPPLALANPYRDEVDPARYWISEKLDGVRALWDGTALYSRRGIRFSAPPWFTEGFPLVPLDGELWMERGAFETLSGLVRRHAPDEEGWRRVRFMAFDLPAHPADFDGRLGRMRELFATIGSPYIALVEQFRVADRRELMVVLRRVTAEGGEGLMLRKASSLHRAGRSDDLLKLKLHQDAEAKVIGHLPGKGKYAGMLGALLVEMPDGRRFRLGTGFTDEQRQHPPPLGATVTYKHYGFTGNGIPRFASFLRVREDAPKGARRSAPRPSADVQEPAAPSRLDLYESDGGG